MELLLKLLNWIIKIMRPDTTDRITEDTAGLQRKIVYRNKLLIPIPVGPETTNQYFTPYVQEDGASYYVVGTMSVTIPELKTTGANTYTIDAVKTYENDGLNYQSFKLPFQAAFSSAAYPNYFQEYWNVKLDSDNGSLKIIFDIKTGGGNGIPPVGPSYPYYIYYVIYSTKITDEDIL